MPFLLICLLFACMGICSCATAPVTAEQRAGVAVWDIEDLSQGGSGVSVGELLSSQVMEALKRKGVLNVVERVQLLRVLDELHLGSSALADEPTRLRLGKLVGARLMVFGGYQVFGGQMRIDLRLVEVETGKVLKAVHKTASSGDLSGWMDAAGRAGSEL